MSFFERIQQLTAEGRSKVSEEYKQALAFKLKAWEQTIETRARAGQTHAICDTKGWRMEWLPYADRLQQQGFHVELRDNEGRVDWARDYRHK